MLEINKTEEAIVLRGRWDAAQSDKARPIFDSVQKTTVVDCRDLDYISSAGLGILLKNQKRLQASGHGLKLMALNDHVREIFSLCGFDQIFMIE